MATIDNLGEYPKAQPQDPNSVPAAVAGPGPRFAGPGSHCWTPCTESAAPAAAIGLGSGGPGPTLAQCGPPG